MPAWRVLTSGPTSARPGRCRAGSRPQQLSHHVQGLLRPLVAGRRRLGWRQPRGGRGAVGPGRAC
eukprot:4024364-Alexandrium_andersonii.AAC.1